MLKLNIKATNIKLDDPLYQYISEKIGTLDKFIEGTDSTVQAWVEVGRPSRHHKKGPEKFYAEVNIRLPGKRRFLRSEAIQGDLRLAIDEVKDELQRELKEYKDKQEAKYKRGARVGKKLLRFSPLAWFRRKGTRDRQE